MNPRTKLAEIVISLIIFAVAIMITYLVLAGFGLF